MTIELVPRNHVKIDRQQWIDECMSCGRDECVNCHGYRPKREGKRNELKKPVDLLDMEGNYIRTWPSASDAARSLGMYPQTISNCLRGRSSKGGKYRWRYANGD